jgi:PTH1 family peptidyl-tRNA hydrolase
MKLIIGIGNPGEQYKNNRHNVGFMVLDEFSRQMTNDQWSMDKRFNSLVISHQSSVILAKPQTFMNNSGIAVKRLVVQYKAKMPDLWIIHDDLDIALGAYKIQKGKGPKEHKGLLSIYNALGTKDFWHVRVGIENRTINDKWPMPNDRKISGEEYVLQDFDKREIETRDRVIERVTGELVSLITDY